jgi:hypothetical protein
MLSGNDEINSLLMRQDKVSFDNHDVTKFGRTRRSGPPLPARDGPAGGPSDVQQRDRDTTMTAANGAAAAALVSATLARSLARPPATIDCVLDSFRAIEPDDALPGVVRVGTCRISFDVYDDGTRHTTFYTLCEFDSIERLNEARPVANGAAATFAPTFVRLPERRWALYAFPHDPGLPQLASCLDRSAAAAVVGGTVAALEARPLKHDPARGCTMAVDVTNADGRVHELVAKTHRGDRLERTFATMSRLAAAESGAGWSFPRALGYDPARRLLWQERARGVGFWAAAASLDLERVFTAMARATAAMHAVPFAPAGRRAAAPDPRREQRALAARWPERARRHAALWERLGAPPAEPEVSLHGDLHPNQFLIDGDHVALTDFDKACWGPPGEDVGCFVSHVLLKSLEWSLDLERFDGALENYRATYVAASGAAAHCGIWHTAAHLLGRRTRKLVERDAAPEAIDRLLALAEGWIERVPRS